MVLNRPGRPDCRKKKRPLGVFYHVIGKYYEKVIGVLYDGLFVVRCVCSAGSG